jgi:hypothetical protein
MKIRLLLTGLFVCASVASRAAVPLTESTFTEIIKEANVVAATTKAVTRAVTNQVFRAPDLVRTGPNSRLEMTAPDKTITRIGENSVFTFEEGERSIRLEKGSVLFHPPAGVGGGKVKYGGTAAAVLGTTMVCAVGPGGVFNIVVLEGEALVTLANGKSVQVGPGQTVNVSSGGDSFSPVMAVHLGQFASHLVLIRGFSNPLSSMSLIQAAIEQQNADVAAGKVIHFAPPQMVGGGLEMVLNQFSDVSSLNVNTPDNTTVFVSPD